MNRRSLDLVLLFVFALTSTDQEEEMPAGSDQMFICCSILFHNRGPISNIQEVHKQKKKKNCTSVPLVLYMLSKDPVVQGNPNILAGIV